VVYYKIDDELKHKSFSDDVTHDAAMVYEMQKCTKNNLKKPAPHLKKWSIFLMVVLGNIQTIKFFIKHKSDFNIEAKWIFSCY